MTVDEEVAARTYQYKHGDRPLDGYTIQRAAGRGGFGEVYYAISDSGREVALKLVLTYEQIELRGISQCMNIKSPQLVTIFDVKQGADGRPWVIMEYVSGPSLHELLADAPSGLGTAKAAFFLREIGKGLTYLHDCGIVHRDLKPGNIFYENGYVKIGDYGLSKAMSMSRHSGQTIAVGTLHYMAPEIGEGRYDRTIDIYALGALLFEMVTGQVPFFGSSVGEVLMKHLNSEVCLDGIEEPFQSAIRKAMAKNPADRFQSVQEMVEAVFGSEQVRNSVSQFSPASLTMVAGRAARGIGGARDQQTPSERDYGSDARSDRITDRLNRKLERARRRRAALDEKLERLSERFTEKLGRVGDRVKDAGDRLAAKKWIGDRAAVGPAGPDPLSAPARSLLAFFAMCLAAFVAALGASGRNGPCDAFFVLSAISGALMGVKLAWRIIGSGLRGESKWVQRFALGAPAAFGAAIVSFPCWAHDGMGRQNLQTTLLASVGAMLLMQWECRLVPDRKERLSIGHLFTSGICALIFAGMMDNDQPLTAIATVVGASVAVSLSSVWGRRGRPFRPIPVSPATPPAPPQPPPTIPPLPSGAMPIPPPPMAADKPARRRRLSRFPGFFGMLSALLLWAMCFAAVNHGHKPDALLLLVGALFVTIHILTHRRGGFMSNSSASMAGEMMPARSSLGGFASSVARGFVGLIGTVFLTVSILLALSVSMNVPGLFASGVLNPGLPHDLAMTFGTPQWPRLMTECATAACLVTSMLSIMSLLIARRSGGGGHVIRTVLGVLVLLAAAVALGRALPDLGYVTPGATPGQTVDLYFQQVQFPAVVKASLVFLLGAFLLGWPPRRYPRAQFVHQAAPAKQEAAQ